MFDSVLKLLAPHICCSCGYVGAILCEHCRNDIVSEPYDSCVECGTLLAASNLCANCRKKNPWEDVWVAAYRAGAVRTLVDLYKFERLQDADEALADLLSKRLPLLPADTVVTYVPGIASHRRQRGYETMERIARQFAKKRNLSAQILLRRTRDIEQRGSKRKQRLIQQYEALEAIPISLTSPILLIDDIYTTGGTLRAAARRLKNEYGQPVYVAVIARQPLDDTSDL